MSYAVFAAGSHSGDTVYFRNMNSTISEVDWPTGVTYYTNYLSRFATYTIGWTLSTDKRCGQFANRDQWVVGPVTIIGFTPASTNVAGRIKNGTMVNPRGGDTDQAFDNMAYQSYGQVYTHSKNKAFDVNEANGVTISAGSSVISSYSVSTANSRPQLESAAILTVLDAPPAEGSFRPAYCGTDKSITHNKSELNYALLLSLPTVSDAPALATTTGWFTRPWLDYIPGWQGACIQPRQNMPYYGADIATTVGVGAQQLHLNYTNAQKADLMIGFTQLGLDTYGIIADGGISTWQGQAGHGHGRKWPVLFAGLVLNDSNLTAVAAKSGDYLWDGNYNPLTPPKDYIRFGEDDETFYVAQEDVDWTNGPSWWPDVRDEIQLPYDAAHIGTAEWGVWHCDYPTKSNRWLGTEYREVVSPVLNGITLPAILMRQKTLWNHDALFDYVDRWNGLCLTNEPNAYILYWRSASAFSRNMWDAYRSQYSGYALASAPSPANNAVNVSSTPTLTWTTPAAITTMRVYFGTDSTAVANGTGGTDKGTVGSASYEAGSLTNNTTYYWRVKQTKGSGSDAGTVWQFTTQPYTAKYLIGSK